MLIATQLHNDFFFPTSFFLCLVLSSMQVDNLLKFEHLNILILNGRPQEVWLVTKWQTNSACERTACSGIASTCCVLREVSLLQGRPWNMARGILAQRPIRDIGGRRTGYCSSAQDCLKDIVIINCCSSNGWTLIIRCNEQIFEYLSESRYVVIWCCKH